MAEAAAIAAREGAGVRYCSANARGQDLIRAIDAARADPEPNVIVLEDLEAARPDELTALAGFLDELPGRSTLVVTTLSDDAPPRIKVTMERMVGALGGESHRRLGPLDRDAVRAVAALYTEEAVGA